LRTTGTTRPFAEEVPHSPLRLPKFEKPPLLFNQSLREAHLPRKIRWPRSRGKPQYGRSNFSERQSTFVQEMQPFWGDIAVAGDGVGNGLVRGHRAIKDRYRFERARTCLLFDFSRSGSALLRS
jgi:hypothetical protein